MRHLAEIPGEVGVTMGCKCVGSEEGKVVCIPFEGYYESKGGRIESPRLVVARNRQTYIFANICVLRKSHQFAGSLHKSLVAPASVFLLRRGYAIPEECGRICAIVGARRICRGTQARRKGY